MVKSELLTDFYQKLFTASDVQKILPPWVRLGDSFDPKDLEGMPRIDGLLLRTAINLFASNKSCADDGVVSEMLNVLAEDVLETLAAAFERRILNREEGNESEHIKRSRSSRFVEYPLDEKVDKLDGHKRPRGGDKLNYILVDCDVIMNFGVAVIDVEAVHQALLGPASTVISAPCGKIGPANHAGSQHQALPGPANADLDALH